MARDLLQECNTQGAPLDVFAAECCRLCINPDCTRSRFGQSLFERRVNTWEERLFQNPSRMSPDDPRFVNIAGKRFLTLDTSRTPEVRLQTWADPRDMAEAPSAPLAVLPPTTPVVRVSEPASVLSTGPQKPAAPGNLLGLVNANTPAAPGRMLSGAPAAPTEKRDPWASPVPPVPPSIEGVGVSEKKVRPGTKIKLGGAGDH